VTHSRFESGAKIQSIFDSTNLFACFLLKIADYVF